jgi:hypothetical protein
MAGERASMTRGRIWRRMAIAMVAGAVALSAVSCSSGEATGGLGVQDAAASQACAGLADVMRVRAGLSARELRAKLGEIYTAASASDNTLVKTRAVALFADATVMATGGQSPSLDADLAAMTQACSGQGA